MHISVVIPAYNRAGLLLRALESVFAQSRPPDEVLVVDDGSSDDTATLVQRGFPGARYLYQRHCGVSQARNRGILASSGDWIALLDSDDVWHRQKLAYQCEALQGSPSYRLVHCNEQWMRRGEPLSQKARHQKSGGDLFARSLELCLISPSAVMMARSLLDEVGLFNPRLPACEDYDLWLRICCREQVLYVPEVLVTKHGGRTDQLSNRIVALDRYRIRVLVDLLESGVLDQKQRNLAVVALHTKIKRYQKGVLKRGRVDEAERLRKRCVGSA